MNRIKGIFLIVFTLCFGFVNATTVTGSVSKAIKPSVNKAAADEITFVGTPSKKDGLYAVNEKVEYNVEMHNTATKQAGSLSYIVFNLKDKELKRGSQTVSIEPNKTEKFKVTIPGQESGFYKLMIIINATDYDDTIRRVFGVDPKKIKSATPKPADFDKFWADTRDELDKIAPNFKMTLQPEMEKDNISVYLVEAKSLDNLTIRGWFTVPKNRKRREKLPVWLVLPGYGGEGVKPIYAKIDLAVLSWNVRGQGNSRDVIHPTRDGYITTGLQSRKKYIYRGAIMDCIRGMDFICSRPEVDTTAILCVGASMGGYLSIITSSLDKRVKLCSANNPVYSDFRSLVGSKEFPMKDIEQYAKANYRKLDNVLDDLDYFDLKNFSGNLKCKSVIGIGLLDNLAPPYNQYVMINNINPSVYKLFVYPELAHEVPQSLYGYLSNWSMDEFGIF